MGSKLVIRNVLYTKENSKTRCLNDTVCLKMEMEMNTLACGKKGEVGAKEFLKTERQEELRKESGMVISLLSL